MGNKFSTEFEKSAGKSMEQIRKNKPSHTKTLIVWKHIEDINLNNTITLKGGAHWQNIVAGEKLGKNQKPDDFYNNKNYKLVILSQLNTPTIILGVNTINDLLNKKKITRADLPITDELYNKIITETATNDDLVPTLQQIADITYTNIEKIKKANPGVQEGGKRKKTLRRAINKRSKTRKH